MDYLIHVANLLILGSFLVRDILWLRLLSIGGGLAFMGYFAFALPDPLWAPVVWNGLFGVINLYQIARLMLERRPVFLDPRERRIRELAFPGLSDRELLRLVAQGRWESTDDVLVSPGERPSRLILLAAGRAEVLVGDQKVAELEAGRYIGEMAYLTGRPASALVRTMGPAEILSWPADTLRAFLDADPTLCAAVQRQLGADLATKLRKA